MRETAGGAVELEGFTLFSMTKHATKRTMARVAVAGAVVAAPLAVLAIPAQAETVGDQITTEVRDRHGKWDRDDFWDNKWNRHDRWDDDCDPWDRRHHHPGNGWRQVVPPGWFGSS